MSKNKYCGSCKHFKDEGADGFGWCAKDSGLTGCGCSCHKHEYNYNGWTEITPDNVKELYKDFDRVIIAHFIPDTVVKNVAAYEKPNELYRSLEMIAELGGYYYYVLPELNTNDE